MERDPERGSILLSDYDELEKAHALLTRKAAEFAKALGENHPLVKNFFDFDNFEQQCHNESYSCVMGIDLNGDIYGGHVTEGLMPRRMSLEQAHSLFGYTYVREGLSNFMGYLLFELAVSTSDEV